MGALTGYFDDSGDPNDPQHNCVVWAGYVGPLSDWKSLEQEWNKALFDSGVPYLHMREVYGAKYPYDKWGKSRPQIDSLLVQLAEIIGNFPHIRAIGSAVDKQALNKFNRLKGWKPADWLEPKQIAIYCTMWIVQDIFGPDSIIDLVFDKVNKPGKTSAGVNDIGKHEMRDKSIGVHIAHTFIDRNSSSRGMPALQIADFLAWELRKFTHERIISCGVDESKTRQTFARLRKLNQLDGIFVEENGLIDWDRVKGGAWPNTWQGRNVPLMRELFSYFKAKP